MFAGSFAEIRKMPAGAAKNVKAGKKPAKHLDRA